MTDTVTDKVTAKRIAECIGKKERFGLMLLKGERNPTLADALKLHDDLGWRCSYLENTQAEDFPALRRLAEAMDRRAVVA